MTDWKIVRLNEIAESVDYGVTASAIDHPIGPKFLRITDIQNGTVDWDSVPWCECDICSTVDQRLNPGDIVFARTGATTGKSFLIQECPKDAIFASYLIRVRVGSLAEPRYISHFFQTPNYWAQITKSARGVAQPGVNATILKELKIPLPTLEEQKRIADVLDRAEALRAKRRAALDQLDELTQSIFIEIFGDPIKNSKNWENLKFSEVGTLQRGKSKHRPRNAPELLGGKYPLIQTGDIANSGGYITEYTQTYSELGLKQSKMWSAGTLCITIAANIAKTGILTFDACFPDSVVGFIPNEKVKIEYVQYWMSFLQKMLEESAPESAQKNINLKILFDLNIPVPPLELQNKFTSIVHVVEKIKQSHQQSLLEINNLFDSLSYEAFTGKLFSHQFFEREIENGVKI